MLILNEAERPDVEDLFSKIEELCQENLQVADRLYYLNDLTRFQQEEQPHQPYQEEDQ